MGPTASGKTDLALQLAEHLPAEIISVDSALVYRGMDIGTAKPSATVLSQYPHHLIDIRDPAEPYSAADFCRDAHVAIQNIIARGKMPILVGGTMLYYRALQQGLSILPSADESIRQQLADEAQQIGWQALHERLTNIDPQAAAKIHPHDPQRLQRALEVYQITGQTLTELQQKSVQNSSYHFINIGLIPSNRDRLRKIIAQRFDAMLATGLIDEVMQLYERGDLHAKLPAIRAVGYRQVWQYLEQEYDQATMRQMSITATCQLAKRQLTWLRSWPDLYAYDSLDTAKLRTILLLLRKFEIA